MSQYEDIIIKSAESFRLDANLIRSIISTESSGITTATRFEPNWHYFNNVQSFADKLGIPREEEEKKQATSWGLMQVMGGVARDLGFTDDISMLLVPDIGIFYGSKKLRQLFDRYGDEDKVVSAYNQGSPKEKNGMFLNQRYCDRVYTFLRQYRKLA